MISASPPSGPNINLNHFKDTTRRRLLNLLKKFEGPKAIVFDDKLIGPFESIANATLLKQHDATRLFRLSGLRGALVNSFSGLDYILILVRKDFKIIKMLAEALKQASRLILSKISLVMVPQRCAGIEKLLELNKIDLYKLNSIEELAIEFFVMDSDVFSMENEFVFRDIHLNEDYSSIHHIVEGLGKFQEIYGQIPLINVQGESAKLVRDLLMKQRKRQPKVDKTKPPQIHQLIIIDRSIDLITPLVTQLTYEGLLDEIFGIQSGFISLPAEKFAPPDEQQAAKQKPDNNSPKTPKRIELRSTEDLYARLRDCHINAVASTLKKSAMNLQAEYEDCKSEGKTIHEMGKIVKRLQHLKLAKNSQSNHVTIAELLQEQTSKPEFIYSLRIEHELLQDESVNHIMPDIETKLLRQEPALDTLRLICLQSIVNNGLKQKISDHYRREIVQNYGQEFILLMLQLERANILQTNERAKAPGSFSNLKKKYNLINEVDECNPSHLSYVYGGYAPLSVIIAKSLVQTSQDIQSRLQSENSENILVFFIGGCTFAEISALRFLSQQEDSCKFIIGTSKIVNGRNFLSSMGCISGLQQAAEKK